MSKRSQKQTVPIIIEPYPEDYNGYPFITLLQYKHDYVLTIVDNVSIKKVSALVLDRCGPEQVNEQEIVNIADEWYTSGCKYPLSIEFSKRNMVGITSRLFRSFELEYITRVIGPLPQYNMEVSQIKRRRKKNISKHISHDIKISKDNL